MERPEFTNPTYEKQFLTEGYLLFRNFISEEDVNQLVQLYKSHHKEKIDDLMWNSLYHISVSDSKQISKKILEILDPYLKTTFKNFRVPVATLMSKCGEKPDGFDTPHRDYSVLDESNNEYRQFWLPIVDINHDNGAMYVVPKSHHLKHRVLPMMDKCIYRSSTEILQYATKPIYMNAGDLLVYADKMIHGGHPNVTDEERPVVHFGLIPENAEIFLYKRDENNAKSIVKYRVSDEFYLEVRDFKNAPENLNINEVFIEEDLEVNLELLQH
jgi:ectoine hydroxylase-related dioxygenase (phytanoyl-CoA dioxygenase family)